MMFWSGRFAASEVVVSVSCSASNTTAWLPKVPHPRCGVTAAGKRTERRTEKRMVKGWDEQLY